MKDLRYKEEINRKNRALRLAYLEIEKLTKELEFFKKQLLSFMANDVKASQSPGLPNGINKKQG